MKIGIAYDTPEMYDLKSNRIYYDFAEQLSINELQTALNKAGYCTELLGNVENILERIKSNTLDCDLVYNTVEGIGSRNREGLVPAILEANKTPYIGTDAMGLSLTLDKRLTKLLAKHLGITTPNHYYSNIYTTYEEILDGLRELHMPVIIKPNYEGNSSGISIRNNIYDAANGIMELITKYKTGVLCEEFIRGHEITVPVIGNDNDLIFAATTVDIQDNEDFWLDVNCKVFGDYKNVLFEDFQINQNLFCICRKLFAAIGCQDFSRFDFRIDKNKKIYFIEANPLPALFKGGSFDVLGKSHGLQYNETLQLIINTARKRLSV